MDVGGTFTDFVYMERDGSLRFFKTLSTPKSPEVAVINGLKTILREIRVEEVVHATTIATNMLRGQTGLKPPKVALVTTAGFEDVIEIGRQNRPSLYDPFFEKPKPLVPRELRFGVKERVDAEGRVLKPLDPLKVDKLGLRLKELGVESVAVCFLHSYLYPFHEKIAGDALARYVGFVSASHKVAPEPREYERASTTVVNAALMPVVSTYLNRLSGELLKMNVGKLLVMSSSGGIVDVDEAAARPVQVLESGPAAGVVAAAEYAKLLGLPKVVSFDMGGTTAKAGVIVDYEVEVTGEYEVGGEVHHGRTVKGSGYPVRFPFIDLAEVSAGGGTVIWRDEEGALKVGPMSAGADPGPACYCKGGREPTVTDANLILGRIGESLLEGSFNLDREAAFSALSKLGDPVDVADEALKLVNLEMARAVRLVTAERGLDPSEYVLIAFGGAGPQHAAFLAEELGMREVIVPPHPGVFSALGLLVADWRLEARRAYPDPNGLEKVFGDLEAELAVKTGRVDYFIRYVDVRYEGQGWELTVPVGKPASLEDVKRVFEEKHLATFHFKLEREIEIVVAKVFAVQRRLKPKLYEPTRPSRAGTPSLRRVYMDEAWMSASVYWRRKLPVGFTVEGPAVIEEYDSTTVVPPGWKASLGALGELRLATVE